MKRPIGLMGPAGAGKSTLANFIAEDFGYVHRSFATGVREEVEMAFRNGDVPAHYPYWGELLEYRNDVYAPPLTSAKDIIAKKEPPIRKFLQWWGTEWRRAKDPSYWLKRLNLSCEPDEQIVVDDVRFYNEALFILALGGAILYIDGRRDPNVPAHASEQGHNVFRMLRRLAEAEERELVADCMSPHQLQRHIRVEYFMNLAPLDAVRRQLGYEVERINFDPRSLAPKT